MRLKVIVHEAEEGGYWAKGSFHTLRGMFKERLNSPLKVRGGGGVMNSQQLIVHGLE
jgi:hypothetical protein